MIKAVLLDLDNTLLWNPDRQFARAFLASFERHFVDEFGLAGGAEAFRNGIRAASEGAQGQLTNAVLLLRCLADGLRLPIDAASAGLATFYAGPYDELRELTSPVAGADQLLNTLLEAKVLVAIATNPIYPEVAILQRLAWAGLSAYIPSLAFITNSETMHYAKPRRAYYAELTARLGVEPDECLVVGDSHKNDIAPAKALGMRAWQVKPERGLKPVLQRLDHANWQHDANARELRPDMLKPQFMGNLAALAGLLAVVKPHQWLQRPDPGEWSILQILCHLWQAESAVHQQRLQTILSQDNPFIPALPPPGPNIPACHDSGLEIYAWFRARRLVTMDMLAGIGADDWARPARHSIFGMTTLLEMAHFTAQHDRLHINQLCQTLGKCAD